VDGAVLGPRAFVLRYFDSARDDRLLVVNLGTALLLEVAPEPLLGAPGAGGWRTLWSSDARRYGGGGELAVESKAGWRLPAEAAVVLRPRRSA
jgi:maltooligosyltrehalose trehalohydrolase